jgi:hypothetical protein
VVNVAAPYPGDSPSGRARLLVHADPGTAAVVPPDEPGGFLWSQDHATSASAPDWTRIWWTAFSYSMPTRSPRFRLAAWRELARIGALCLQRTIWAVPHGESGEPPLGSLLDIVSAGGGQARVHPVDGTAPEDVPLERRLADTCERLWDGFFNDVDRLAVRLDEGVRGGPGICVFEALRERYVGTLVQDIIGSDASERAWRRLRSCGDVLTGEGVEIDPDECYRAHALETIAAVAGTDGRQRYLVAVVPLPTDGWERAFQRFEAYTYRPDATRIPLERGMFSFRCSTDERPGAMRRLAGRLERFEQSIA